MTRLELLTATSQLLTSHEQCRFRATEGPRCSFLISPRATPSRCRPKVLAGDLSDHESPTLSAAEVNMKVSPALTFPEGIGAVSGSMFFILEQSHTASAAGRLPTHDNVVQPHGVIAACSRWTRENDHQAVEGNLRVGIRHRHEVSHRPW